MVKEDVNNEWVYKAFWLDERKILYALGPLSRSEPLQWFSYNIENQTSEQISSPLHYDPLVWEKLGLDVPLDYPELRGLVSPSGKYVLFTVSSGNMFTPTPPPLVEFWLEDTASREKIKFLEQRWGTIWQVYWLGDEEEAVMSICYEGPCGWGSLDTQTGSFSWFPGGVEYFWSPSPDGSKLATYGMDFQDPDRSYIQLVLRETGEIRVFDQSSFFPFCWSSTGSSLFYWAETQQYFAPESFRRYDLETNTVTTLFNKGNFQAKQGQYWGRECSISPDGNRIAIYGLGLLIVTLAEPK